MYQVTAIYQNCEIGYGEGEGLAYAKQECVDSVSRFYDPVMDQLEFIVIANED